MSRKRSKVNTLVNSLVNSTNTQPGMVSGAGQGGSKVIRSKKMAGSSIQKSLESPMRKEPSKAADLIMNHKVKQGHKRTGAGEQLLGSNQVTPSAAGPKKRFYNSMVVSGVVSEAQTPKVASQSSHQVTE